LEQICIHLFCEERESSRFYDAIILEKADHFLMMHRREEFNQAQEEAIRRLSEK